MSEQDYLQKLANNARGFADALDPPNPPSEKVSTAVQLVEYGAWGQHGLEWAREQADKIDFERASLESQLEALKAASLQGAEQLHAAVASDPRLRQTMANIMAMLARTEPEPEAILLKKELERVEAELAEAKRENERLREAAARPPCEHKTASLTTAGWRCMACNQPIQ